MPVVPGAIEIGFGEGVMLNEPIRRVRVVDRLIVPSVPVIVTE